jgi:hypothetical protein
LNAVARRARIPLRPGVIDEGRYMRKLAIVVAAASALVLVALGVAAASYDDLLKDEKQRSLLPLVP